MTPGFAATLDRLAIATSVIRTRSQDAVRHEANGGSISELKARYESAVVRLERIAERLEKATA
jgi:hypothetical protein